MQKVETLVALPGCCWNCRSNNRDWYVDTGQSIEFFGAVFICNECILEMGHIAGMKTPDEVFAIEKRAQNLDEDNFDLRTKVSGLEQAIDGLRIAGRSIGSNSLPTSANLNETVKSASNEEGSELGSGTEGPSEPLHDPGMAVVSNDGGSDDGFRLSF